MLDIVVFKFVVNLLIDINECELDKTLCTGEKQSCENIDGSYECKCEGDLIYDVGSQTCIPKPKGMYHINCTYLPI